MPPPPTEQAFAKQNPFDSAEQEVYVNLVRTYAELSAPFGELFRSHGLSEASYNLLRVLRGVADKAKRGQPRGLPSQALGCRLVARVPDVTRLVDRLQDHGLVERTRGAEDKRVVLVAITPQGRSILKKLDQPVLDLHRGQLGHLSAKELQTLTLLLAKARPADESDESEA